MLGNPFAPETVTRIRAASQVDPYSGLSEATDWDNATELNITTLAPAEPRPAGEPTDLARNAVVDGYTLYVSESEDVTAQDRMRVRGEVFDVLGTPAVWLGAGMLIQCGRTEG